MSEKEGWTSLADPNQMVTKVEFTMTDKLNMALPPREVMRIVGQQVIENLVSAWLQENKAGLLDELRRSPLREEITHEIARLVADDLKEMLREALK